MVKRLSFAAVCAVLTLTLAGNALAKGAAKAKTYHGTVVIARTDMVKVNIGDNKPMHVVGVRGPNTVVTAGGKPATWEDLGKGQVVNITISGAVATTIDIQQN